MDCGGKAQPRHRSRPRQGSPQTNQPSPAATGALFPLRCPPATILPPQSARGQAHCKTLRAIPAPRERASVLECGGPPPLFPLLNNGRLPRPVRKVFRQPCSDFISLRSPRSPPHRPWTPMPAIHHNLPFNQQKRWIDISCLPAVS